MQSVIGNILTDMVSSQLSIPKMTVDYGKFVVLIRTLLIPTTSQSLISTASRLTFSLKHWNMTIKNVSDTITIQINIYKQ